MTGILKGILDGIYNLVSNYGVSIVLFTILVRLCLMPLDYKSRVGMRKMSKLAPKQAELQKKYEKDPEKMQRKLAELYKAERVSPLSSCWPMLVSMPILFAMFGAMRTMANEQLIAQAFNIILDGNAELEQFLWIKNLWMPDSPFNAAWPSVQSLSIVPAEDWMAVINEWSVSMPERFEALKVALGNIDLSAAAFEGDALQGTVAAITGALEKVPNYAAETQGIEYLTLNLLITKLTVVKNWNGLFLLPIMSAVSQYLMTVLNPTQQPQPTGDQAKQPSTGNFMKWFFPLFSLWLCSSNNAAFALYWVTSNLIAMVQNFGINKYLDHKEALAAGKPDIIIENTGKGIK